MERIYRDNDVDLGVLKGRQIAVIGYGIQGKVQAANIRDSESPSIGKLPTCKNARRDQPLQFRVQSVRENMGNPSANSE